MPSITLSSNLIDTLHVKKTDFEASHKQFLILCGKKQFYCGLLIKEILIGLNENKSLTEIHSQLIQHSAYQNLTPQDVEKIIDKKIMPLGVLKDAKDDKSIKQEMSYDADSIKTQKTLLNESKTHFLASVFKFFYQKWAVILFVLMGLFAHLFYLSSHSVFAEKSKIWAEASALEYLLIYFFIIFIFVFHEVGHASAALHYGIRTPRIGYGFYLVYPVFFTEISEAWKLRPKKRMVINLGGIYFQWVAGTFFILLDYFNVASTHLWGGIVVINLVRLLYSFVPFMKADGYWIFSDGFGLTNLRKKSNQFLAAIFKSFSLQKARQITETKSQFYALTFFSFGTILFFSFWFAVLGILIWKFAPMLPVVLISFYEKFQTATSISQYLKVILQSILLCITLLGVAIFIIRMIGLLRFAIHFLLKKESEKEDKTELEIKTT
jgi:putative peptide zinc metalloprotease protein